MLRMRGSSAYLLAGALLLLATGSAWAAPERDISGGIRAGRMKAGGGSIYYEVAGSGEPLVLIHDGLLHGEVYEAQVAPFSDRFKVILYDRRGYGRSSQPETPFSDVADLLLLLDELKVPRASLLGMSAGGRLAVDFTLAHPDRVEALVLVGAVVSGMGYTDHFLTRGGRVTQALRSDGAALLRYYVEEDPYEIAPSNASARERARAIMERNSIDLQGRRGALSQRPSRPAVGFLSEIGVPTLIVIGDHDIPDVHAHAGALEAGIPGARRIIIPGAGHLVPLERPAEFNAAVLKFLANREFYAAVEKGDAAGAAAAARRRRSTEPGYSPASEAELNVIGYRFLVRGNPGGAVEIFSLNAEIHPESWNVWDSLGEGQDAAGQTEAAIRSYRRSLELNPENDSAKRALERIRGRSPSGSGEAQDQSRR